MAKPAANGLSSFWRDRSAVAAIEFSVIAITLCIALLNVADIAIYTYQRMQLENAAQMGVQAASKACDQSQIPAVTNCPGLTTAVTAAIHSTSLGDSVVLSAGYPTEGYYCINAKGALQYVSAVSSKPANCAAAGMPLLSPGDYVVVEVSYVYTPLFGGLSVGGLFPTDVIRSAFGRLL
jgi:Flp pilus assembly protein TadG